MTGDDLEWEKTYDESAALLLVGPRQPTHVLEHLDTSVVVHEDGIVLVLTVAKRQSTVDTMHQTYVQ